jgi:hypothetical protein
MGRDFALWTGILTGPIVWLMSLEVNFALTPWACVTQGKAALYAISIIALLLCAGSGLLAWREWSQLGKEWPDDAEAAVARTRIMAVGGVLLSVMFFLVIVAQAIPQIILKACD